MLIICRFGESLTNKNMELTLEDLKDALIYFSPTQSNFLTENCIVALESIPHLSNCELDLSGVVNQKAKVNWSTTVIKNGYKEPKKYTEKAAEALSFLVAIKNTEYDIVEESIMGTGIDYWLGYKEDNENYDEFNFFNARLEVSGILKETASNSFLKRIKEKKDQTKASDGTGLPAYVSVVEFSNLKVYFDKK